MRKLRPMLAVLTFLVCLGGTARGQTPQPDAGFWSAPNRLWVSAGLGGGRLTGVEGLTDGYVSGNYSHGPLLLMVRSGSALAGPFFTDEVDTRNRAVLVGLRTSGSRAFLTQAFGIGSAARKEKVRPCESCSLFETSTPRSGGLVMETAAHANYQIIGIAVHFFGLAAPHESFWALSLSIEAGWFGRS